MSLFKKHVYRIRYERKFAPIVRSVVEAHRSVDGNVHVIDLEDDTDIIEFELYRPKWNRENFDDATKCMLENGIIRQCKEIES